MSANTKRLSIESDFSIRKPARYSSAGRRPCHSQSRPANASPRSVQPTLQAAARRRLIRSPRRPKPSRSTSSIATTKPPNANHIQSSSSMQKSSSARPGLRSAKVSPAESIGFGLAIGLAAFGTAIGVALVFSSMIQATARQPEARGDLQPLMWLGFALTEAVVFYGLVRAELLLFLILGGRGGALTLRTRRRA